jgi:mannan endo-1,4-beta-mannosidase
MLKLFDTIYTIAECYIYNVFVCLFYHIYKFETVCSHYIYNYQLLYYGGFIVKKFKKLLSYITAMTMVFSAAVLPASSAEGDDPYAVIYQFEDGVTEGDPILHTDSNGAKGYYIQNIDQTASVTVTVPETGMYDIFISCLGSGGDAKQFTLNVNGVAAGNLTTVAGIADFSEVSASSKLVAGENTIKISAAWTWFAVDYVRIAPAVLPLIEPNNKLSNPSATSATKGLMNYLASVYTKGIISGQQEIYNWANWTDGNKAGQPANTPHDFEWEFDYILETTGKSPAIRAFDFLNYSNVCAGSNTDPMYNFGFDDGTVDRMIDWTNNKGGIVTASWHLTVPNDFTNYEIGDVVAWENYTYKNAVSDFVAANVYVEGTKEYEFYKTALDKVAGGMQILEDNNIPLIWRPLHEAQGAWFWWSGEGTEVYTNIWKYTYDYLVKEKGLDNLIWEWNGYAQADNESWYPGDEYVDLVAFDKYNAIDLDGDWSGDEPNESAIASTFYDLGETFGQKMIAMSENDTVPSLTNLVEEKAYWLYFCPWYEDNGAPFLTVMNNAETLTELYNSDYCVTLDELPNWKIYGDKNNPAYGDVDCDGDSARITDVILLSKHISKKLQLPAISQNYINANCSFVGDSQDAVDTADLKAVVDVLLGTLESLPLDTN